MSPFKKHFISCYLLVSIFIGVVDTANAQKNTTLKEFWQKSALGKWRVDSIKTLTNIDYDSICHPTTKYLQKTLMEIDVKKLGGVFSFRFNWGNDTINYMGKSKYFPINPYNQTKGELVEIHLKKIIPGINNPLQYYVFYHNMNKRYTTMHQEKSNVMYDRTISLNEYYQSFTISNFSDSLANGFNNYQVKLTINYSLIPYHMFFDNDCTSYHFSKGALVIYISKKD